ncbi:MAG: hypothetical protein CL843_15645 [Crocinitomicaceae bacterium]|nr:hypothetical protein [Crocinitomicaceae bacterium]
MISQEISDVEIVKTTRDMQVKKNEEGILISGSGVVELQLSVKVEESVLSVKINQMTKNPPFEIFLMDENDEGKQRKVIKENLYKNLIERKGNIDINIEDRLSIRGVYKLVIKSDEYVELILNEFKGITVEDFSYIEMYKSEESGFSLFSDKSIMVKPFLINDYTRFNVPNDNGVIITKIGNDILEVESLKPTRIFLDVDGYLMRELSLDLPDSIQLYRVNGIIDHKSKKSKNIYYKDLPSGRSSISVRGKFFIVGSVPLEDLKTKLCVAEIRLSNSDQVYQETDLIKFDVKFSKWDAIALAHENITIEIYNGDDKQWSESISLNERKEKYQFSYSGKEKGWYRIKLKAEGETIGEQCFTIIGGRNRQLVESDNQEINFGVYDKIDFPMLKNYIIPYYSYLASTLKEYGMNYLVLGTPPRGEYKTILDILNKKNIKIIQRVNDDSYWASLKDNDSLISYYLLSDEPYLDEIEPLRERIKLATSIVDVNKLIVNCIADSYVKEKKENQERLIACNELNLPTGMLRYYPFRNNNEHLPYSSDEMCENWNSTFSDLILNNEIIVAPAFGSLKRKNKQNGGYRRPKANEMRRYLNTTFCSGTKLVLFWNFQKHWKDNYSLVDPQSLEPKDSLLCSITKSIHEIRELSSKLGRFISIEELKLQHQPSTILAYFWETSNGKFLLIVNNSDTIHHFEDDIKTIEGENLTIKYMLKLKKIEANKIEYIKLL